MRKLFYPFFGLAAAILMVLSLGAIALASNPGAVWTTDSAGNPVNQNLFQHKWDVFLNGGPKSTGAPGLPDGDYYVQVTAPNGVLLGSSVHSSDPKPVHVTGGRFEEVYSLWEILLYPSSTDKGYDDTANPGHEYKVWISLDSSFPNSESKTDNFKVLHGCYY